MLGHKDDIGPSRYGAVGGNPSGVAAHYFNHHDAMMRFGRRV